MNYFIFKKYLLRSSLTGEGRTSEQNFKKSDFVNVRNNVFENYGRIVILKMCSRMQSKT